MASPWVVEIAFGNIPNAAGADLVWTDVSTTVRSVETERGATREHDLNQPGTATVVLSNADRRYDPTNLDGPYVDGNGTQVLPMTRLRIRLVDAGLAVDEGVFEGFVEGWGQNFFGPHDAVAVLTCTDAFLPLSKTLLPSGPFQIDIEATNPKYWWRLGEPAGSDFAYDEIAGDVATVQGNGTFGNAGLVAYDSDTAYSQPGGSTTDRLRSTTAAVLPASAGLRLNFAAAAYGSRQAVTTPDHVDLDGGTSIDVRARIQVPLTSAELSVDIAGKQRDSPTNLANASWFFTMERSGAGAYHHVRLTGNAATGFPIFIDSYPRAGNNTGATSVVNWTPGELRWFAFTAAPSGTTGVWNVNFYTNTNAVPNADVTTWTQVGVTQSVNLNAGATLSTALNANTAALALGALGPPSVGFPGGPFDSYDYYRYEQRKTINGTKVADVDFTSTGQGWAVGDDAGDTGTDATGKVFTIEGVSATPQILGPTAPFSAEAIVQFTPDGLTAQRAIIQQGSRAGTPNYWSLSMTTAGFPRFDIVQGANTGQVTSSVSVDDNQEIHHVAITYSSLGVMKIYVDGVNTTAVGDTQLATMATAGIAIGNWYPDSAGGNWAGTIDEVLIFDRELTAAEVAAHFEASTTPWAGDTSGERIEKILDAVSWPADRRNIDTGDSVLQSSAFSGSALDIMQNITLSELIGSLFVARNGDIRFISRSNQFALAPVASFSDAHGSDDPVSTLAPDYGVWLLRNSVTVTRTGGQAQRARDLSSIARYLTQSYDLSNLVHDSDELSLAVATSLVEQFGEPKLRIAGLTIVPSRAPAALLPVVAGLELEDWVDVTWTPQGAGDPVTITCIVESISHEVAAGGKDWTVQLNLSPAPVGITPVGVITGDSPAPPGSPVNLNSLENRVAQLEDDVDDLVADLATTNASLTTAQGQITALQTATADSGWIAASLNPAWAYYGIPFPTPAYRKIGNQVFLKGLVTGGTPGSTIFTLPVGYRPIEQHLCDAVNSVNIGSTVTGGLTGGPTPNVTGAQSAGTAHTHGMGGHNHVGNSLQPQVPNASLRVDITTGGAVNHTSSGSNGYQSLSGISFFVN